METSEVKTTRPKKIEWNIHLFERAVKEAQVEKRGFIEVPQEYYDTLRMQLLGGLETESFYYGKPGVRVYPEGKREQIETEEAMDAETWTKLQYEKKKVKKK